MSDQPPYSYIPFPGGNKSLPIFSKKDLPKHIAIVMDGNGRWANLRGLPRIEGHKAGEKALLEVVTGAVELGIKCISVYAFSTENWRRSPEEVYFLLNLSREIATKYREIMHAWGVRIVWSGRKPKLWKSVIREIEIAEKVTKDNKTCVLNLCINYGSRSEVVDAASALLEDFKDGKIKSKNLTEKTLQKYLYQPLLPDVDLFLRTSGEQRISNFMLWQSAYAELVFLDTLWPDMDRYILAETIRTYISRERRYGGAIDKYEVGQKHAI